VPFLSTKKAYKLKQTEVMINCYIVPYFTDFFLLDWPLLK